MSPEEKLARQQLFNQTITRDEIREMVRAAIDETVRVEVERQFATGHVRNVIDAQIRLTLQKRQEFGRESLTELIEDRVKHAFQELVMERVAVNVELKKPWPV